MINELLTNNLDLWTSALLTKSTAGRGTGGKVEAYGIKKLRELILELAVRGKLVPQNPDDEPARVLLERIRADKARLVKERKIRKDGQLPPISDEEAPYELPKGWEWVRLGSLGNTQTGSTPSTSNQEYFGEDYPFIKPADISEKGIRYDSGEALSQKGIEKGRLIPAYSVLMVCIGGSIGKVNYIDRDCSCNQQINTLTPYECVGFRLLHYFMASPVFKGQVLENAPSTTLPILSKGKWEVLLIPLPPLAEQHRIVAKVDELMALCDQLEQNQTTSSEAHQTLVETLLGTLVNAPVRAELVEAHPSTGSGRTDFDEAWTRIADHFDTLFTTEQSIDQLKQAILQLAVMGKLVPQDSDDEPASVLLKKIAAERTQLVKEGKARQKDVLPYIGEKEEPYVLPNGWEWARLGQIIDISSGDGLTSANMDSSGEIPVYGGNGVTGYHNKANIAKRTLVIGRVGYYCGSIHITPASAWVTDNAFVTTFSEQNIYINYLYWLLKGTNLKENENATAQPVISGRKLYPIVIGLPPTGEQHRIVAKVDELMTLCDNLMARLAAAQTTQIHLADTIVEQAVA